MKLTVCRRRERWLGRRGILDLRFGMGLSNRVLGTICVLSYLVGYI
jgi:hypothetical protein